jgi:hypothetical protein
MVKTLHPLAEAFGCLATNMSAINIITWVISLCAISLTAYGLYATRRHNRLSVTPHLSGCRNKDMTSEGFWFSYDISNNGIGPAKIKKFILFRNGKISPKGKDDYVEALIHQHLGDQLNYQIVHQFNFGNDVSMKAGDTRCIVKIFFPGAKQADQENLLKRLEGLDAQIEYESFYGQKFIFDTKDKVN